MANTRRNRYTYDTEPEKKVTYEATPVYLRRNSNYERKEDASPQRSSRYTTHREHESSRQNYTGNYMNGSSKYSRQYSEHHPNMNYEPRRKSEEDPVNKKAEVKQEAPVNEKKTVKPQKKKDKNKKVKVKNQTKIKRKLKKPRFIERIKSFVKGSGKAKVIIGLLVVLIPGVGVLGYTHRDQSVTKVCESNISYNKGIGYTFYVGKDGKTIDTIEKNDTVSLNFIKKNLGDENAEQILSEYKNKTKESYETVVDKYKKYSWFSSDIKITKKKVAVNYRIRVSDETFSYKKYEDVMSEFGMTYFYDQDKKAFIYDESSFLSTQIPLGSIEGVQCYTSDKTLDVKPTSELKKTDGDKNE